MLIALSSGALLFSACAGQECDFNSQCGERFYCERGRCRQDCREDFDCAAGERCNVIGQCRPADEVDAGPMSTPDAGSDAGPLMMDMDAGPPVGTDAGPPVGTDAGPPVMQDAGPLGRYLDRCSTGADCMSGECVPDTGGSSMCSRGCSTHADCASEHVCASGYCQRDDTGAVCSGSAGCLLGLCAGDPSMGTGRCTRPCASASDCPAGYGCSDAGGVFVCVNIEQPCSSCGTGLCLASGAGCTTTCRSPSDCPATFAGLAYACTGGVCEPSALVVGADPIGATCRFSGPDNLCRSGACINDAGRDICSQRCTETGGCGPGFGCGPIDDGMGGIVLVCQRGGAGALGSSCSANAECDSALCAGTPGFCTRLCTSDGFCPTGYRCVPNGPISICEP